MAKITRNGRRADLSVSAVIMAVIALLVLAGIILGPMQGIMKYWEKQKESIGPKRELPEEELPIPIFKDGTLVVFKGENIVVFALTSKWGSDPSDVGYEVYLNVKYSESKSWPVNKLYNHPFDEESLRSMLVKDADMWEIISPPKYAVGSRVTSGTLESRFTGAVESIEWDKVSGWVYEVKSSDDDGSYRLAEQSLRGVTDEVK